MCNPEFLPTSAFVTDVHCSCCYIVLCHLLSSSFREWPPPSRAQISGWRTRDSNKPQIPKMRTDRFLKSPIRFFTRILNEDLWNGLHLYQAYIVLFIYFIIFLLFYKCVSELCKYSCNSVLLSVKLQNECKINKSKPKMCKVFKAFFSPSPTVLDIPNITDSFK